MKAQDKNRKGDKVVYLCGPINDCTDDECTTWREKAKKHLPKTLDPMRRDYRGREADCVEEIVEADVEDILNSDILLAFCPKPSVGTSMEIFFAHSLGMPVVTVVPEGASWSPWLTYHTTYPVRTLDLALKICNSL